MLIRHSIVMIDLQLIGTGLTPGITMSRMRPSLRSLDCSNPNMPRSIRARVGATSDPIPKGKHIEEPK